ncbi:GntR family transcriptional regulator [Cohnella nanjingensis]|uniref:GntR family transcriptional regulator n=1 Tax=Cohnella nanjingensis TaxID=1387779 RepID=A0A7X0RKP7_9BACL|nr:GntR family transcriptional regulator [Cohnella nanjingensis]MBB6669088.1 GntR family transcriptional regulator [Cohnella nanjingensis]
MDERGQTLSEQVHLALRESIVRGELPPGRRLLVLEIANALEISQAPVREALERLKQEGLLDSKSNKGSVVADIRKEEIEEIYALRELIEWHAVRQCLPMLRQSDLDELDAICERMRNAAESDDHFRFIDLDMDFHRFFFAKAGNRTILQLWDQITVKIKRFLAITNKLYFPDLLSIAEGHSPLIEALRAGDEAEIERRFIRHINEVWWRMDKSKDLQRTRR